MQKALVILVCLDSCSLHSPNGRSLSFRHSRIPATNKVLVEPIQHGHIVRRHFEVKHRGILNDVGMLCGFWDAYVATLQTPADEDLGGTNLVFRRDEGQPRVCESRSARQRGVRLWIDLLLPA
jgi:hypothetical protein